MFMNNDSSMNSVQIAIRDWAEYAVSEYLRLIRGNGWDYGFYTQSDLRDIVSSPEYFIMQINPGSGGTYEEQKADPNWRLNGKDMDASLFIQGNFNIDVRHGKTQTAWQSRGEWKNWQKLRSFFCQITEGNPLNDVSKFVLTNASFFNTKKAIDQIYETLPQTLPITLNLVERIRPKRIVVLGCKLRAQMKGYGEIHATGLPRIYAGHLRDTESIYIDHPSSPTYKGDIKNLLQHWSEMPLSEAISQALQKKG